MDDLRCPRVDPAHRKVVANKAWHQAASRWLYSTAFRAALILSVLSLATASPPLCASTVALSNQEIASYQTAVVHAQNRQSVVSSALACLASRSSALLARRDTSQIRLGGMRTQEQTLRVDVVRQQAALDGHREQLYQEQRNLEKLFGELRELQAKQAAQDQEVRDCKSSRWTINLMCDLAADIAHLTGLFDNVGERIQAAEHRVNQARDGVSQSRAKADEAQQELDRTTRSAAVLVAEIRTTEAEIGASQAELSSLREQAYRHQLLLDEFTNALAETALIDVNDGRMRTARDLRDAARRFEAGAARLAAAITHAGEVLPPESAVCIQR